MCYFLARPFAGGGGGGGVTAVAGAVLVEAGGQIASGDCVVTADG